MSPTSSTPAQANAYLWGYPEQREMEMLLELLSH